jgi:hypothetical protein
MGFSEPLQAQSNWHDGVYVCWRCTRRLYVFVCVFLDRVIDSFLYSPKPFFKSRRYSDEKRYCLEQPSILSIVALSIHRRPHLHPSSPVAFSRLLAAERVSHRVDGRTTKTAKAFFSSNVSAIFDPFDCFFYRVY